MKFLVFVLAWSASTVVCAQSLSKYLVQPQSLAQIEEVAENFEVLRRADDGFEILVDAEALSRFESVAPEAQLLVPDIHLALERDYTRYASSYLNWSLVRAWMEKLPERFPGRIELVQYGESRLGKPLYALKITDSEHVNSEKPELLITSATHGDELITVEVTYRLIEELLSSNSERMKSILRERVLYFVPVVNPDGYERRRRYSANVDPNRAYPLPSTGQQRSRINCTEAIIRFFHERNFLASMDIHAYGQMVMYPWAYTYGSPADDAKFSELVTHLAEQNRYAAGQISKVIYKAPGSSADYYYWKKGTWALAVEIATSKVPRPEQIPLVVDNAREMLWRFTESF